MNKINKKIFVIGVVVLIIDQLTKILASTFIGYNESITIIDNFFSIVNISNTGAAFSILEGRIVFLVGLSFIIMVMLYKMIPSFENNRINEVAFGLLFGGIFGNLGDRMFLGLVRDFLKFRIFGYNFPVFNIADVGVVMGVFLLVCSTLKGSGKNGSNSRDERES